MLPGGGSLFNLSVCCLCLGIGIAGRKRPVIGGGVCARVLATAGAPIEVRRQGEGYSYLVSWREKKGGGSMIWVSYDIFHGSGRCGNNGLSKTWPTDNRLLTGLLLPAYSLEPLG